MHNLTPTEYFKDFFVASSESKYFKVIRAIRLDSPGSYFKKKGVSGSTYTVIILYALVRTDKKTFTTGSYIINNFEEDNETIKRNNSPIPGIVGKYLKTNNSIPNSQDSNFSKSELDAFELDSNKQLEYINTRLKRDFTEDGPWSIIQDPWDPSVFVDFIPSIVGEPIKPDDNIVTTTPPVINTPEPVAPTPIVTPPIKLQSDFNFDVKKSNTFIITNGNNGNLVSLPDGTIVDIGELTIVRKEDPNDPEIIKILTPYSDQTLELDSEYTDETYAGAEEELVFLDSSGDINSEYTNSIKGFDPENPDDSLSTDNGSKYPISKNQESNIKTIIKVAKQSGITNSFSIAAMLAICKKESGLVPQSEAGYSGTAAFRIKSVFSKFKNYSDDDVNKIKKDHKKFFDIIYGGRFDNGPDEGHKYRGRGFNQITFKANYQSYKERTGYDIVSDPDSLNKVEVAAKCLVSYFKKNFASAPSSLKSKYNFTDINSFKNLDDATAAFYHANAGFETSYSVIIADVTGGRKTAFGFVRKLYETYLK